MPFSKISPKPCKGYTYCIMQVVDLFGIFPQKSHFQKVLPSLKVEMTFQKVLPSLNVETHFQNIVSNIRKASTACFPNLSFSDLHTEVFQPFLNQKLTISLHDNCDTVWYILNKQTYHNGCSDTLTSSLYAQSMRSTEFLHWSGYLMSKERPRGHELVFFTSCSFLHVSQRWPEHVLQWNFEGCFSQSSHSK